MFGTVMSYVALRLLGVLDPQAPEMKRGMLPTTTTQRSDP